jgi:hypothetical protein
MNAQIAHAIENLSAAPMIDYEFLFDDEDFVVSLNGDCHPSSISGFSVDANRCFVLHRVLDEVLTLPMPPMFVPLVMSAEDVVFVRFEMGEVKDYKACRRVG